MKSRRNPSDPINRFKPLSILFVLMLAFSYFVTGCSSTSIRDSMTPEEIEIADSLEGRIGHAKARLAAASAVVDQWHAQGDLSDRKAIEYAKDIKDAQDALKDAARFAKLGINTESEDKLLSGLKIAREVLLLTGY